MSKFIVVPHAFTRRVLHWPYCANCGLVKMRNDFSLWAQAQGCNNKDHPRYEAVRKGE